MVGGERGRKFRGAEINAEFFRDCGTIWFSILSRGIRDEVASKTKF